MVTQIPRSQTTESNLPPIGEEHITLHNISWETFEHLLEDAGSERNQRFYYLDGTLEIMAPLFIHEGSNRFIERLICAATEEVGMDCRVAGSVTLKLKPEKAGAEPDSSYYIQSESLIRHLSELDLQNDPPPDLVLEVDVTHPLQRRFPIYARLGIPELWQCDVKTMQYYVLQNGQYQPVDVSPTFPWLMPTVILEMLEKRLKIGETQTLKEFRAWVRAANSV
jgi:Uma2 family endonuclease